MVAKIKLRYRVPLIKNRGYIDDVEHLFRRICHDVEYRQGGFLCECAYISTNLLIYPRLGGKDVDYIGIDKELLQSKFFLEM